MRGVRGVLGLLFGACCAAAVGCGAAQSKASAPAPSLQDRSGGSAEPHAEPHVEIDTLDRQIAGDLARAHVAVPATAMCTGPACATAMSQPFSTPAIGDARCRPASTDRCTDACTLSTSICTNQQKICDLAKQLAGDDWAANKCETARASCQAARDGCCSCVL